MNIRQRVLSARIMNHLERLNAIELSKATLSTVELNQATLSTVKLNRVEVSDGTYHYYDSTGKEMITAKMEAK